jgi:hypothetical protein
MQCACFENAANIMRKLWIQRKKLLALQASHLPLGVFIEKSIATKRA